MHVAKRLFSLAALIFPAFCTAQSISRSEVAHLIDQGLCDEAEVGYRALYDGNLSQRAQVDLAMCYERTSFHEEALSRAEDAIQRDPYSWQWADLAYLTKARACTAIGCSADAREAIATLRARFPDTSAAAESDLIEARLDQIDPGPYEAALQVESLARAAHDLAVSLVRAGDYEEALGSFDATIMAYPGTRQALRSMKVRALLLGLMRENAAAMEAWQEIASRLEPTAPNSALHYEAIYRIALLHQGADRRDLAVQEYEYLMDIIDDPKMAAKTMWQYVGARFEILQRRTLAHEFVSDREWDGLRQLCNELKAMPAARLLFKSRADLMFAESLLWQREYGAAIQAAANLLETYDSDSNELRQDIAGAHQIIGEALLYQGEHSAAQPYFEWIVQEFGTEEIWPGLDNLARAYYRLVEIGIETNISDAELDALCADLTDNFPQSRYAVLVRRWRVHTRSGD